MEKKQKKSGRPKTGRKRKHLLNGARFTQPEKDKIILNSKNSGLTQSDFILIATDFYAECERVRILKINKGKIKL